MKLNPDDFKIHDLSRFPLCVFDQEAARTGYAPQWEAEMLALLRHGQPFSVAYVELRADESTEDRRHRAVWLKQNKERLARYCKALISVEPDAGRREQATRQGEVAVKAFGIPHEAVATGRGGGADAPIDVSAAATPGDPGGMGEHQLSARRVRTPDAKASGAVFGDPYSSCVCRAGASFLRLLRMKDTS